MPLFRKLGPADLNACLDGCLVQRWDRGQVILEQGTQTGLGLHVLVLGSLDLVSKDERTGQAWLLGKLWEPGDVCGPLQAVDPCARGGYSISAAADQGATTLSLPAHVALKMLGLVDKEKAFAVMEVHAVSSVMTPTYRMPFPRLHTSAVNSVLAKPDSSCIACARQELARERLEKVRAAHEARTSAVQRLQQRLHALRQNLSLVVELEKLLLHTDFYSRCCAGRLSCVCIDS